MPNTSLHPNILFHFTNKQALFGILSSNFRVSYARENIRGPKEKKEFGVPMVSFCDLKLSELENFINEEGYGKYGIGVTKSCANRNNLNPVMYINKHCSITDDLINGIDGIFRHLDNLDNHDDIDNLSANYNNIINLYRYIKNYEGDLKRRGKPIIKNYRFADDREWRYVPDINTTGIKAFVPISEMDTSEKKRLLNASVQHLTLHFTPEDIKYLIIKDEDEIVELMDHLEKVKNKYDLDTRRRLSSRILTIEQIQNDI